MSDTFPSDEKQASRAEMVERVARAMFDVGHADAHGPDVYEAEAGWWREIARAAIEAMP